MTRNCPTPGKRHFANQREATINAMNASKAKGKAFRFYHCSCGSWHITSQPRRERAE